MIIGVFSGPPTSTNRPSLLADIPLLVAIILVALFGLLIGTLLLTGAIAPERAYWLFALPPLVLAIWYGYGFLAREGRDFGLAASGAGWLLVALTFILKHFANLAALGSGRLPESESGSPLATVVALAAIAALISGAVLSARYWKENDFS